MSQSLMTLPGGAMLPYMSARRRHEIMDTVFEMIGGVDRLAHEAQRDSDSFWKFMALWGKGLPRVAHQEVNVGQGVEDLVDRLDELERAEKAQTIDGTVKVVDTAP